MVQFDVFAVPQAHLWQQLINIYDKVGIGIEAS